MALRATIKDITFSVGDTVKINYLIKEGEKERSQPFIGMVINIRGRGDSKTFTVRKTGSDKVAIERIFPLNSPWIKDLSITRKPKRKIRRAKLTYVRNERFRKL